MGLWERVRRLFSRRGPETAPPGDGRPPLGTIPAPATLVAKVERLDEADREMIRVAEEAHRRGFDEQALAAYWKAARHYQKRGDQTKQLATLSAILRLRPDETAAHRMRGDTCYALDRRRDAAVAYAEAARLLHERGDGEGARDALARAEAADPTLDLLLPLARAVRGGGAAAAPAAAPAAPAAPPSPSSVPVVRGRPATISQSPRGPGLPRAISGAAGPAALAPAPAIPAAPAPARASLTPAPAGPSTPSTSRPSRRPAPEPEPPLDLFAELSDEAAPHTDEESATAPATEALQLEAPPPRPRSLPVRFAIPDQATTFDGGLPGALRGTEHDPAPDGEAGGGTSDPTRGVPRDELQQLLDQMKRKPS